MLELFTSSWSEHAFFADGYDLAMLSVDNPDSRLGLRVVITGSDDDLASLKSRSL